MASRWPTMTARSSGWLRCRQLDSQGETSANPYRRSLSTSANIVQRLYQLWVAGSMADHDAVESFDAVVIGAGAGGMATAALLLKRGYRTLLVEREPQVGGRASTVDVEGFGVNTGAQIFELGGANKELFDEVGVPIRARKQATPLLL